jgi:hypothetical protein
MVGAKPVVRRVLPAGPVRLISFGTSESFARALALPPCSHDGSGVSDRAPTSQPQQPSSFASIAPLLVRSHEEELHEVLEELVAAAPPRIANVVVPRAITPWPGLSSPRC